MTLILVLGGLLVVLGAVLYNRLVQDRNRVDSAWSDIDVQLQRRHDLVPRLVEAVKQYASYEQATLEAVTELRSKALQLDNIEQLGDVESTLFEGLNRLVALAEQYPDLKASSKFLELQEELVETENYLQFARRYYNGAVRQLNTRIETVPSNLVAGMFGFTSRPFFQKASDSA